MFVSHFLIGSFKYAGFAKLSFTFFICSLLTTIGFSVLLNFVLERRIEIYRTAIKGANSLPAESVPILAAASPDL
jgi:hypothetical protein